MPVLLSSLIDAPAGELPAVLAAADDASRCCLRDWLARVPDPRSRLGRWHPLEFVLALAICAFTAAGHDSLAVIAEWAAGCCQSTLAILSGRRDPGPGGSGRRAPARSRGSSPASTRGLQRGAVRLPRRDASQPVRCPSCRDPARAGAAPRARAAASPGLPGLLEQAAADGKTVRGAVRPDGSQVHLLSVFDVGTGCVRAQREIDAKTNEIPELAPAIAHLDLTGTVVTLDALHTQAETARHLVEDKHAHYLMIIKANQPTLLESAVKALAGPDAGFAGASRAEEGKGTAAASGGPSAPPPPMASPGRTPPRSCASAATPGPRRPLDAQGDRLRHHQPAPGSGASPPGHLRPQPLGRRKPEHYVRDKTFSEDLQQVRTGNQPNAYAATRNLVTGAFRRAGFANIAHARRYYGRDDQRILTLYGYT